MSLLFMDGFDHMGTGLSPATVGKWATGVGSVSSSTGFPRTGPGHYLQGNTSAVLTSKALPASGGFVVGVAIYVPISAIFRADDIVQILEGATVHLTLGVTAGGLLNVKRGATTLATGTTVLALAAWYYLEFKGIIDDTAGSYEVRIDGVAEAALTTAGPVDTRNVGTTGQWDRICLRPFGNSQSYIDDLYVCDTSGAAPRNTFLGLCKVETIYPQTDAVAAGSNAGLTPSTGTDHGALVDENPPNTTDYNSSPTVGLKDTYQYPALSLTGTILGVQTNLYVAKSDAAVRQVCAVVRAGGTDYDGASVAPTTTFQYFSEMRAQNPNTSADWTSGEIASLEAGMKVTV